MNRKLKTHQLGRKSEEEFRFEAKHPVIFLLDNVRSAHNVGAFFRTADALGIEELWLAGICPVPPHREIRKTALGATESVAWQQFESSNAALIAAKALGYEVIAVEQAEQTTALEQWSWNNRKGVILVFGNEVDGVDQAVIDQSDEVIEITQFGTKHSFNVSVTGGIVGWHVVQQFLLGKQ